jgi:hypothetical protein
MSCLICLNFLTIGKSGMRTKAELAPLQAVQPLIMMLPSSLMCNRERMILDSVSVLNFGIGLVLGFSSFPGYQTRNRSFARPSILDSASLSTSVQVTNLGFSTFSLFAKSLCCALRKLGDTTISTLRFSLTSHLRIKVCLIVNRDFILEFGVRAHESVTGLVRYTSILFINDRNST